MPLRDRLQRLGAGRLAYLVLHRPLGAVRASVREGGPLEQWRTARGRAAMEETARSLPLLPPSCEPKPLPLHLLSGRRFWYQTAFCLWSFARHSGRTLAPVIYDDGTLTAMHREPLARLFPAARFVSQAEVLAQLDVHLPATRFPVLRERWQRYPNIRKLTDPHAGCSGWKLVIDSDLLFFRRPGFLLEWLAAPNQPLHAVDVETSYGYSRPLLEELAATPIAELVNVGLCGLRSEALDWEKIEWWCHNLIAREGTSYYLEQALVAILVAAQRCAIAPAADYVTLPEPLEARECRAVMHHYVADAKRWYFRHCWKVARIAGDRALSPP